MRLRSLLAVLILCLCVPAYSAKTAEGVGDWAKQLKSSKSSVRDEALNNLMDSTDPKTVQVLRSAFSDPAAPDDVVLRIMSQDMRVPRRDVLDCQTLLRLMESKNDEIRRQAPQALQMVEMPRDLAIAHMQDKNLLVRAIVAKRLVNLMDERGIKLALDCLQSQDQEIRYQALEALRGVLGGGSIEAAKKLISDKDPAMRGWAVEHLAQLRDHSLLDTFTDILQNDKSVEVRSAAAEAVGQIGDPSSVPVLIKAIKGDDIAEAASKGLFEITDPAALPQFVAALKDKNPAVRSIAVQCIFNFNDEAADNAVLALVKNKAELENLDSSAVGLPTRITGDGVTEQMARRKWARAKRDIEFFDPPTFGSVKITPVVAALGSSDGEAVQRSVDMLKALKDKSSVPPLIKLLDDKRPDVRNNAAYILGFIGDDRAYKPLAACLGSGDRTSTNAARALQRLGRYDLARAAVIKLLDSKTANTRIVAAVIIGDARDKTALKALIGKLQDPDAEVRKAVVYAISRADGEDAAKALFPLMAGGKGSQGLLARRDYHEYPGFVFEAASRMQDASAIMPDVIKLLQGKDPDLAKDAAWLLGQWKEKKAVDPMISALQANQVDWPWRSAQISVAKALGEIGDPKAIPALIANFEKDPFPNSGACEALGKIKSEESYNYLLKVLNSPFKEMWRCAAKGLGEMRDPRAADALASRVILCQEAAFALAKLGDKRAYEPLVSISEHYGGPENISTAMAETGDPRALDRFLGTSDEDRYFSGDTLRAIAKFKSDLAVRLLFDELRRRCQFYSPVALTSIYNYEGEKYPKVEYFRPERLDEVQAAIFPALAEATGQSLGTDSAKWIAWRKQTAPKKEKK